MNMRKMPHYACQRCDFSWHRREPGPVECPVCGHLYVRWTNYQEWTR